MLREGSDYCYKPKKGTTQSGELTKRTDRSQRVVRVSYTEVEISSGTVSEGTVEAYELGAEKNQV